MHADCTIYSHIMDRETLLVMSEGKKKQLSNGPEQR